MKNKPDDFARLIHESLEQLGWKADVKEVIDRINRLDAGLPLEDEFSIICGWLGRCRLIHKLDQQQYPLSSKSEFQVPDLIGRFILRDGNECTVLIEVKTSKNNVLSFKPEYYEKLKAYGDILGLPVLVAWKKYNLWSLVSIDEFSLAKKNYNLSFGDAMKNSLLGIMAGDFSYTPEINSGLHLSFKKEKLIESVETETVIQQSWHATFDDVYFTNGENEIIRDLSPIAQQLFHSWDLDKSELFTDTHIELHYVVKKESSMFAHMALTRLLLFYSPVNESLHWRKYLSDHTIISTVQDFRKGIEENLKRGTIKYMFDLLPASFPVFLKKI